MMRRTESSGLDDGGKVPGSDSADEVDALVGAVAERGVRGLAAAAKSDGGASTEAESVAGLVDDLEIAFDADGTVVEDCHFGTCHECPPRCGSEM